MATLHIRDIPDAKYARLKRLAAARGVSLTELVTEMIGRELALADRRRKMAAALDTLDQRTAEAAGPGAAVTLIDAVRAERERVWAASS
jgi:plasmid stability protein